MTAQARAAVWLDHQEARVFHVDLEGFDERTLAAPQHHVHRHPRGASEPTAHPNDLNRFFGDVAKALDTAERVLLFGPSTAKAQFYSYLREHWPALARRVVEIESSDHPTQGQMIARVKEYFHVPDARVR